MLCTVTHNTTISTPKPSVAQGPHGFPPSLAES